MAAPLRGEIWLVNLDPVQGHEQGGKRPALVVSDDTFNQGPAGLVLVVPVTSRHKGIPIHVAIDPPEGGLKVRSYAKPEDLRSVSVNRLNHRWGAISTATMTVVEDRLRVLLRL